jgi:hypothetical protein
MGSLERKLTRKQKKETKKLEKKMAARLALFDQLPENCLVCNEGFDKKNKEQTTSWQIVVQKGNVRLYCPDCWGKAQQTIKSILETRGGKNESS